MYQLQGSHQIGIGVINEILQGITNGHAGCKMDDGVGAFHGLVYSFGIQDVSLKKAYFRGNVLSLSGGQIVQDMDLASFLKKCFDDVGTDKTGPAGHKYFLRRHYCPFLGAGP